MTAIKVNKKERVFRMTTIKVNKKRETVMVAVQQCLWVFQSFEELKLKFY